MNSRLIDVRGGNLASIQTFLIISTCFLYLVAAGLFSKAVWAFEIHKVSESPCKAKGAKLIIVSGISSSAEMPQKLGQDQVHMIFVRVYGTLMSVFSPFTSYRYNTDKFSSAVMLK